MLVTRKTHNDKVAELGHTIALLEEYNRARDAVIGEMAAEKVKAYTLFRECLTILQSINTRRTGGDVLRTRIESVVVQARELGILDAEEEVQHATE